MSTDLDRDSDGLSVMVRARDMRNVWVAASLRHCLRKAVRRAERWARWVRPGHPQFH